MATATGQYATLAGAKRRIFQSGTDNTTTDTLIAELCDDVNSWIESRTQRILAPLPPFASTLVGSAAAGDLTVNLASVTGLADGIAKYGADDLLIGLVSGTHESPDILAVGASNLGPYTAWLASTDYAIGDRVTAAPVNGHVYENTGADGTSDLTPPVFPTSGGTVPDGTDIVWTDLGLDSFPVRLQAPLLNGYADATVCQTIYVQDGFDALEDGRLFVFPRGIIVLAALELSPYTGGPWGLVSPTDFFLRPSGPDLDPGWPYTECWMTNIPQGTPFPTFYPGFGNIRFIGPGPCTDTALVPAFGFPAIPDTITDIALKCVVVGYRARSTAGTDTQTINVDGSRTFEAMLSWTDRMTLDRFRAKSMLAV